MANDKNGSDDLEEIDNKNELAMITKKIRIFMWRKRYGFKKRGLTKEKASKEKEKQLDEYKKLEHFKGNCSLLKKDPKNYRKKVMMAIWSNIHDSNFEVEGEKKKLPIYILWLMRMIYSKIFSTFIFEKSQDAFYEPIDDLKKLNAKNKELKKLNQTLTNKKNKF